MIFTIYIPRIVLEEIAVISLSEGQVMKPPYIERLHPRKDTNTTPYWHRIRSNPFRRNYH